MEAQWVVSEMIAEVLAWLGAHSFGRHRAAGPRGALTRGVEAIARVRALAAELREALAQVRAPEPNLLAITTAIGGAPSTGAPFGPTPVWATWNAPSTRST